MSLKTKKAVASKKETHKEPQDAAKHEKKSTKSSKAVADEESEAVEAAAPVVDQDELEEQEDAAAEAAGGSGGGNAAALAAAGGTEMSASFKNFRHHPDMENFYRFIYENDLRHEALAIIDDIIRDKQSKKVQGKPVKGASH